MSIQIFFEPRDLWIGVFWDRRPSELRLFICFIPCIPILIKVPR